MKNFNPSFINSVVNTKSSYYLNPYDIQFLIKGLNTRYRIRNTLIILLLYQTDIRVSEVLSLIPSDFKILDGKTVILARKDEKSRILFCPEDLFQKINSYITDKKIKPDKRLFPIRRLRLWQVISEASLKAGFKKKVTLYHLKFSGRLERFKTVLELLQTNWETTSTGSHKEVLRD